MKLFDRVLNPREIRRRLGLNQEQFWTQIGVTQSGGSRYESGREMPKPVRELLRLEMVQHFGQSRGIGRSPIILSNLPLRFEGVGRGK